MDAIINIYNLPMSRYSTCFN